MFFDVILAAVSLFITVRIVASSNDLSANIAALIFFSVLSFMVGHICWSIELDITNPQYNKIIDAGQRAIQTVFSVVSVIHSEIVFLQDDSHRISQIPLILHH